MKDDRVINLFLHHAKIREYKDQQLEDFLTQIGKRLAAIAVNLLHIEPPDQDQLNELLNILADHFSDYSPDEFATAFEYWIIGKLEKFGTPKEHFGKLSPEYVSHVLKAFRRYRDSQIKIEMMEREDKEKKETPPEPMTKEKRLKEAEISYNTVCEFIRINKKMPFAWNWEVVYYWIKFGLQEMKMNEFEVAEFRSNTLAILKSEWLTDRVKDRRKSTDPIPEAVFSPDDAMVLGRMKSIFTKKYLTEKFKLDVQQEILFDPDSKTAGALQNTQQKKNNSDSGEQKVIS